MTDYGFEYEETCDIQHDLAMAVADGDFDDMTDEMIDELIYRNEELPYDCRMEPKPYGRGLNVFYKLTPWEKINE